MGRYKTLTGEFSDLMLGYYGDSPAPKNEEIIALAKEKANKAAITCRPADLLDPEWEKLKADATALKGNNGTDEDVLTFAMFPQVAPKFFETRAEGPKNLGKDPVETCAATGEHAGKITGPITYAVTLDGQKHKVTVAPK
jgi:methylmalonyl-CoA carboxyltransferase 5S subunit